MSTFWKRGGGGGKRFHSFLELWRGKWIRFFSYQFPSFLSKKEKKLMYGV